MIIGTLDAMNRLMISLAIASTFGTLVPASAQESSDLHRGREFAQKVCAECHAVLPEEKISPNDKAPAFRTIANTRGMSRTAIIVWFQSPHPTMPHLIPADDDLDDVIAYIQSLKDDR